MERVAVKVHEEDIMQVAAKVVIADKVDRDGSTVAVASKVGNTEPATNKVGNTVAVASKVGNTEAVTSKVGGVSKVKEEVIRDHMAIHPPERVDVDVTDEIETFFSTNLTRRNRSTMGKTTLYSIGGGTTLSHKANDLLPTTEIHGNHQRPRPLANWKNRFPISECI